MIGGMVLAWSIYYAVSKVVVGATGSAVLAGFLLRLAALVFLTLQLLLDGSFSRLFHQGKAVRILLMIGVFGFLLDLFANLGYAGGSLSTGTALLKTDVLMVNLVTVILYHKKLYASDWLGTFVMLLGRAAGAGRGFRQHEPERLRSVFHPQRHVRHGQRLHHQAGAGPLSRGRGHDLLLQQLRGAAALRHRRRCDRRSRPL